MFQINNYKIVFKKRWHDRRRPLSKKLRESKSVKMPETDGRYDTVCEIYVTQGNAVVGSGLELVYLKEPRSTGVAVLHPNDSVDRVVGKKVALRKALQKAFHSGYYPVEDTGKPAFEIKRIKAERKFQRKEIWTAFRTWVSQWPVDDKAEAIKILKGVQDLWIELHGEAYYSLNGGHDFDKALVMLNKI